ncbi:MAG: regulatory protein RecX [Geobacter sp.]|nr:regulatory protein RecX [Geobacter sp.]
MAGRLPRGAGPRAGTTSEERDPAAAARDCALRLLARRDHSVAELGRKLRLRGFEPELISETLAHLTEAGWLNDRRYAEQWAASALASGRGYGVRLKMELQQRGVLAELASDVIATLTEEHDETEELNRLIYRKFPGFNPLTAPDKERRLVYAFLHRRGFSGSVISAYFRFQDRD